jgi:hypothetical protein
MTCKLGTDIIWKVPMQCPSLIVARHVYNAILPSGVSAARVLAQVRTRIRAREPHARAAFAA